MPSGLAALLDDVAGIAKLAAASVDDVGAAAARAGAKSAGVVIDDTAVTPAYVTGFSPERELPIIWRIALGSLRNKLVILLPAALLLSAFAPWTITPLLMLGGAYLCFEGAEKVLESWVVTRTANTSSPRDHRTMRCWRRRRSPARSAPISSCRPRSWRSRSPILPPPPTASRACR
jgi:predicted DNA repair protein MutK